MTTSPFTALVIFSTHPPLRILPFVRFVAHSDNRNHGANLKLWKIGSLMGIQVAIFRNVLRNLETGPGILAGRDLNAICRGIGCLEALLVDLE